MSLLFAANGDRVEYSPSNPTSLTVAGWFYITDDTQREGIYQYGGTDEWGLEWRADLAGDEFQAFAFCGTTYSNANALAANFAVYGLNKWLFLAMTALRSSPASTDAVLLMGDLTTVLEEPSSYSTRTAGTGTPGTAASTLRLGNTNASVNREFRGRIAWFGMWSRILTVAELKDQQFHPHRTVSCEVFSHLGYNGTTNVPNWAGNALNGTITGTTLTPDHVPLGPVFGYQADWEGQWKLPSTGNLFRSGDLGGLGSGGPFFHDPLQTG
jgi:hypothetical protein